MGNVGRTTGRRSLHRLVRPIRGREFRLCESLAPLFHLFPGIVLEHVLDVLSIEVAVDEPRGRSETVREKQYEFTAIAPEQEPDISRLPINTNQMVSALVPVSVIAQQGDDYPPSLVVEPSRMLVVVYQA